MLAGTETVTDVAVRHGVSRKFVYAQTDKARGALDDAFLTAVPENKVLFHLAVTKTWLRQVIVAQSLISRVSHRAPFRDVSGCRSGLTVRAKRIRMASWLFSWTSRG